MATFTAMRDEARKWQPAGYHDHQVTLQRQYAGHVEEYILDAASKRFPNTYKRMPLTPFNWARVFAENGAAVYDFPPARYLERDGARIEVDSDEEGDQPDPEDEQRARDFAEMVKEAQLEVVMAEAERRLTLSKTMFLKVYSDSIEAKATKKPPRTKVVPFWPADVLVIPHPRCPTALSTCVCLMARVSGDDGVAAASTTWEVWTRSWEDDEHGELVSFGPWRAELVTETASDKGDRSITSRPLRWKKDEASAPTEEYPLEHLPWVEWHAGIPDGCPYLDTERNLPLLFNTINTSLMSEQFAVDMNGATPMIMSTDATTPSSIPMGPGVLTTVPAGASITPVPLSADFQGIRNAARGLQANLAITHRQPADGYDVDAQSVPESGVARRIKNEPQFKARLEAIARAIEVESRLLAVMVEVHDFFRGTSIAGEGITFCMSPQDPPEYEDKSVTQKRAIDARDAGLIDDVEARVLSGYSRTPEEARGALEKLRAQKMANRPNGLRGALDAIEPDDVDIMPTEMQGKGPVKGDRPAKPEGKDEKEPETTNADAITVNEITLGIERMGRLGDVDTVNILRRALAQKLGVSYEGDITAADLAGDAATVAAAQRGPKA